jgi:hypothetical protein
MSKYNSQLDKLESRADNLFKKIHVFFSKKDFSLIRDYYKTVLDNSKATEEDIKIATAQIELIDREYLEKEGINYEQKVLEVAGDNPLVGKVYLYRSVKAMSIEYSSGGWFHRKDARVYLQLLQNAKKYFGKK